MADRKNFRVYERRKDLDPEWKEKLTKCLEEIGLAHTIQAGEMSLSIADSRVVGAPELTTCLSDIGLLHDLPFGAVRVKMMGAKVVGAWTEKKIC